MLGEKVEATQHNEMAVRFGIVYLSGFHFVIFFCGKQLPFGDSLKGLFVSQRPLSISVSLFNWKILSFCLYFTVVPFPFLIRARVGVGGGPSRVVFVYCRIAIARSARGRR